MRTDYQVVILGGGPAGSAAALALRGHGVERVLVVESSSYGRVRIGESIPPDSGLLLRKLGVWEAFQQEGHQTCLGSSSCWGSDEIGYNDFLFNPHGHGWHLDRRRFDAFLARCAAEAGAEVRIATRFEGCRADASGGFRLGLGGERVRARFVVDATGLDARFARAQGARRRFHDRLSCVVGFLQLGESSSFSQLTFLEAVEYGWWYAAKLPGNRLAVALAGDPRIIKDTGATRQDGWLRRLNQTRHLAGLLSGTGLIPGSLKACAASSTLLSPTAGPGWLAAGDASSTFDPISSQGVHKALADGLQAGPAIASYLQGDGAALSRYKAGASRRFAEYLSNRNYFYALEDRWPESEFWRRRRAASAAKPLAAPLPTNFTPSRPAAGQADSPQALGTAPLKRRPTADASMSESRPTTTHP